VTRPTVRLNFELRAGATRRREHPSNHRSSGSFSSRAPMLVVCLAQLLILFVLSSWRELIRAFSTPAWPDRSAQPDRTGVRLLSSESLIGVFPWPEVVSVRLKTR